MTDRIRIVHVIGGGEFGGAERYVLSLVTHLDPTVFESLVACGYEGRLSRTLRAAGYPVQVLPGGVRGFSALAGLLRSVGATFVHTHGVRGNLFGRTAAWRAGVPLIVTTVHSLLSLDYPAPLKRGVYRCLEAATAPLVTHFVTVSRELREMLTRRGVDPDRVSVIPNGVDTRGFRPVPGAGERLRAELGVPADTRLVGIVARLHSVKGHDLFLRAAAALLAGPNVPEVRFLVVGGGEPSYRRRLESQAAGLGLASRVVFLGEREDVAGVLAGLDVAVVSSRHEGYPMSVLEAMACGVPVVATQVGGIPEIVIDGVNGLLARSGDAGGLAAGMLSVLINPDVARRLSQQGLDTARRHSAEVFAQRTAGLYLELL